MVVVPARADQGRVAGNGYGCAEVVILGAVKGQQFGLFDPARAVEAEDVGRAAVVSRVVVVVRTDHNGVVVDRHGDAEMVRSIGIGGHEPLFKHPAQAIEAEDIRRPHRDHVPRVVRPNHGGVTVDRHGHAELVIVVGIVGQEPGELALSQGRHGMPATDSTKQVPSTTNPLL